MHELLMWEIVVVPLEMKKIHICIDDKKLYKYKKMLFDIMNFMCLSRVLLFLPYTVSVGTERLISCLLKIMLRVIDFSCKEYIY